MIVYVSKSKDRIHFKIRAEGDGFTGDLFEEIGPGQSAFGRSYDQWAILPDGPYRVGSA